VGVGDLVVKKLEETVNGIRGASKEEFLLITK